MADAFRGLTLRIGADARPLQSAISAITRSASQAQKQINRLNKALKFDGANVAAMGSKLDLVGDKASHSARAVSKIRTAMAQAVAETKDFDLKKLASQTQDAHSATQKLRDEYNHVDASLQHIYDAVGRVAKRTKELSNNDEVLVEAAQRMKNLSENDAVSYIRKLRKEMKGTGEEAEYASHQIDELASSVSLQQAIDYAKRLKDRMRGTGEEAQKAAEEFKRLLSIASRETGINEQFGQQRGDVQALISEMDTLIRRHNKLNSEYNKMESVQGLRAMQAEVEVFESEVRQAAAEAAKLRTEMHALGTGGRLRDDVNSIKQLSSVSEKAVASAHQMIDAYNAMPNSLERLQAKALAVKTAESTLKAETAQIRAALKKIESDPAFDKVAASSEDAYVNALKLENEYADMTAEMKLAEARADQLRLTLKAMSTQGGKEEADRYSKLTKELIESDSKAKGLRASLEAMDDSHATAALIIQQRELSDRLANNITLAKNLHSQVSMMNKLMSFGKGAREFGFGMYASVTPAIMMTGRYAIQAAEDVDSAYRDMRKTVNGTEEDFEHLKEAALEYSTTHVTSADTILEIEAMGGQLGLAVSDLEAYAETISNLDIATNIDADTAAEQLGKMASVVGITSEEYDEFGDALVRLGNNMPVLESDIMTVMPRFMGMGKVVGMSADEMLGWSAAASATGMGAEAAGSSMQRFISKMETAVASSDEDLQAWADVAGMSVEEFRSSFDTDASGTMYKFIEGLGELQKSGESVNQTLMELGFNNVRDKTLLEGFANQVANSQGKVNLLADSLEMASDAYNGISTQMADGTMELAGDAAREAEKKSEGFSGSLAKMRNQAKVLAVELAEGATPIIQDFGSMFEKLASAVHEMPDSMKTTIVKIAGLVAAIGPASVALGTFAQVVGRIGSVLPKVSGSFVAFGSTLGRIGNSGTKLGTTMTKLGGAISKLGSAGGMIGIAAASIAIGLIADAVGDYIQHVREFRKATEGFSDNAEEIRNIAKMTAEDVRAQYETMFDVDLNASEIRSKLQEVTTANAELSDSTKETLDAAVEEGAKVQYYGDLIMELAGKCDGSAAKMELLKDAVKNFNDLTGSDLQIVNNITGDLSGLNDEIERNIELTKQKSLVNGFSEVLQGTATEIANTQIAISQAEQTQENSLKTLTELGLTLEEAQALASTQSKNGAVGAGRLDSATRKWYDTLVRTNPELLEHQQEIEQAVNDYVASSEAIESYSSQYDGLNEQLDATANALEEVTGEYEANKKAAEEDAAAARSAAAYQAALGDAFDFTAIAEKVGFGADAVNDFSAALYNAGISADEFASMGVEQFNVFREQAAAATSDVTQQVNLIGAAWSVTSENINGMQIDPKHVEITDDGKIRILMDQLSEVEKQRLIELDVEVNDDGVIENVSNLTNQVSEIDSTATVTVNAKTGEAEANLNELGAEAEAIDGETIGIYAEADTEEAESDLAGIVETAEEGATMPISADTEALQSVLGEMLSSGDISADATINFTSTGFEEVNASWDTLKSSVEAGAQGKLTFDTSSIEQAIEITGNLKTAIENIPQARGIYISVVGDALSTISSIWWSLASLPTYKEIEIRTIKTEGERASGGVYTKFASGGLIPNNASGALNGIVKSATLTNIGWVGEAGAEAVMHMRNAGGAVVPLTNRRYVRPFARAVAYEAVEMGGYGMRNGDTYNTTINTTGSGDELARTLTGALNTYSRLHGKSRRR